MRCPRVADALSQGHRFNLVVSDVEDGSLESAVDSGKFGAHPNPELGGEVGERLVE